MSASGPSLARRPVPVLIALANARRPRRAPRARHGRAQDPFTSAGHAARSLAGLGLSTPVADSDLGTLSVLASEASAAASALAAGRPLPAPAVINELATQASGHQRLEVEDGALRATAVWDYPNAPAELASRLINELAALDPARLRECERPECTLLFYDTTRPGTQRWHAEDPCGWHQRQLRHRRQRP